MRRKWRVPSSEDYTIQTISIMMSSTDDHVLYKGETFMRKNELKTTLGRLTLKEKFEYLKSRI